MSSIGPPGPLLLDIHVNLGRNLGAALLDNMLLPSNCFLPSRFSCNERNMFCVYSFAQSRIHRLRCKHPNYSDPNRFLSFSSVQNLLAWGSDCGVVRVLHVDATADYVTVFRQRLHVAPVRRLRFSASGAFLASQSADGRVVFSHAGHGWDFNPVGYLNLTEEVLDFRWSPRESTEGTLYLSLSTGEIVRLEVPETASPTGERLFGNADLKRASFNVDEPVLSFEVVPANKSAGVNEALLVGMTADKSIRHYTLPDGTGDWTGPGGRPRAPVFERSAHAKPGGALGTQLVLSAPRRS